MNISRTNIHIKPDITRVVLRPFPLGAERIEKVFQRVMRLPEGVVEGMVAQLRGQFSHRHRGLEEFWLRQFRLRCPGHAGDAGLSGGRKLLMGAHLTMEYSPEAAALFNPSIVWDPQQDGAPAGGKRFVLSLRATGEGHISSLVFRSGSIDAAHNIALAPVEKLATTPEITPLPDGYRATFSPEIPLGERVLFPHVAEESNGIEDVRWVSFTDDNGTMQYYATYTAYDGHRIRSRLLETADFLTFQSRDLRGAAVENKNLALFPRKIGGRYAMLGRQDNENNYIMFSDDLYRWETRQLLSVPAFSWGLIQLGNCGSPIQTAAGWLVIGHAVGPMRQYVLTATLLDLQRPEKVLAELPEPLLLPTEAEREGYVPNVVYSCGSIVLGDDLLIPYAQSDSSSSFARVKLAELLAALG